MRSKSRTPQKLRSGWSLGFIVAAWLSVFLSPCAMGLTTDVASAPDTTSAAQSEAHHDCHGSATSEPEDASGCCCDLDEVVATKSSETREQGVAVGLLPADPLPMTGFALSVTPHQPDTLDPAIRPPVYLSTQRLRI